ncbi:hypothetical protein ASE09_12390 [Streptomyces sp. Root66D1]|nr:hypothetical protein ASD33_12385 [Streptomyces sp. Root1304]KRA84991.1 hypothetical protein ASE09_12390 [Streptomyces sp. Root66D1]
MPIAAAGRDPPEAAYSIRRADGQNVSRHLQRIPVEGGFRRERRREGASALLRSRLPKTPRGREIDFRPIILGRSYEGRYQSGPVYG